MKRNVNRLVGQCRKLAKQDGLTAALEFATSKGLSNTAKALAAEIRERLAEAEAAYGVYLREQAEAERAAAQRAIAAARRRCERQFGRPLGALTAAERNRRLEIAANFVRAA
jgi:hypothetical protein